MQQQRYRLESIRRMSLVSARDSSRAFRSVGRMMYPRVGLDGSFLFMVVTLLNLRITVCMGMQPIRDGSDIVFSTRHCHHELRRRLSLYRESHTILLEQYVA